MKLTQLQQNKVYQLIALGNRPSEVVRKINKEFKPTKLFAKEQASYYIKIFRSLSSGEQLAYLPFTMQESFANQEVRINDDIKDLQRVNQILDDKNITVLKDSIVELMRLKLSLKNRIGQELGQVRAMSKAGVGNINLMQTYIAKYETIIKTVSALPQEDVVDILEGLDEEKEEKNKPKTK